VSCVVLYLVVLYLVSVTKNFRNVPELRVPLVNVLPLLTNSRALYDRIGQILGMKCRLLEKGWEKGPRTAAVASYAALRVFEALEGVFSSAGIMHWLQHSALTVAREGYTTVKCALMRARRALVLLNPLN
jgi:hypothetical protein